MPDFVEVDPPPLTTIHNSLNQHHHNHHHHEDQHGNQNQHQLYLYDKLDLAESLLAEIEDGNYTCLVCADELDSKSPIWSCSVCYRVYHLPCIKQWAEKSLSFRDGNSTFKTWKCPSCSTQTKKIPNEYRCWCHKELNPPYDGIAPHSCGQTCAAPLSCIHKCMAICHPGPHPECTALGPLIKCFCSKRSKQLPCILTNYDGWQCENTCGELLPCGVHKCQRRCHPGLCGDCPESVNADCYCGSTQLKVPCADLEPKKSVEIDPETGDEKSRIGFFVCDKVSKGNYDCDVHSYTLECDKRTPDTFKCPFRPRPEETCPCGKSKVIDLLNHPRSSCSEPIPTCKQVCGRKLKCGHACTDLCHQGECSPCFLITEMRCRCSHNKFMVPCKFLAAGLKPWCNRRCTGNLHCRRHRCTNICCEFEKKAQKYGKYASWGKGYYKYDVSIEREYKEKHGCTQKCNVLLNCGIHKCQKECHVKPCGPCLESSSDDWVCPCGKTILRAPVRCGTMLPKCPYFCTRPSKCGHTPAKHPCHGDEKECDKCLKLVTKACACGKNPAVKNVPCYLEFASCGKLCGMPMKCGHPCPKMCHSPGDCETKCTRTCGLEMPCGHLHKTGKCHYPKTCQEVKAKCSQSHVLGCKCGVISKATPCKGTAEDKTISLLLPCEEECLEVERKRQLADAFGVDPETHIAFTGAQQSFEYSDNLIDLYLSNPGWSTNIERQVREFATSHSGNNSTVNAEKVLRFPPMKKYERMFIHEMAEAYNLKSQSYDPEPHRNVVIFAPSSSFNGASGSTASRSTESGANSPSSGGIFIPQLTLGRYITKNGIA